MPDLFVPTGRMHRWMSNFLASHGATSMNVVDGALVGFASDGSHFEARLPFGRSYDGAAATEAFLEAAVPPPSWGMALVRKGGFAVARIEGEKIVESKVGQRHVQGRSKAGGWSQQRFARRREQQAREAVAAAARHADRVIGPTGPLVVGGDRSALAELLELNQWETRVVARLPDVREPRRGVFEEAVVDACSVRMSVTNA